MNGPRERELASGMWDCVGKKERSVSLGIIVDCDCDVVWSDDQRVVDWFDKRGGDSLSL